MTKPKNRKPIFVLLAIAVAFLALPARAQKEGNIWYFGYKAGLDFNTGKPITLMDGELGTNEGSASIADAQGKLLFYTDGIRVWNKYHRQMPNGYGLLGNPSSTQSGVIIPRPGYPDTYYIFTVDQLGMQGGLCYSVVDLKAAGGQGDVVRKNVQLYTPSTEKIAAVRHANGIDIWVLSHRWNSDEFVTYLVTPDGVNHNPVISKIGIVHGGQVDNAIGQMTASTDGSKIALATMTMDVVQVFDFDNTTGRLSNLLNIPNHKFSYGVSFSPDNNRLYIAREARDGIGSLTQYDMTAGTPADIIATGVELANEGSSFGSIQLASDGKLYIARPGNYSIDVIENPNEKGRACNYRQGKIELHGRRSSFGLPTFIQSYFLSMSFTFKYTCLGDRTEFKLSDSINVDSVRWDFGDPQSGHLMNTSTEFSPYHIFSHPDSFTVSLTYTYKGKSRTISNRLYIYPQPFVRLPSDTFLCEGASIRLDVSAFQAKKYRWSNGDTVKTLTVKKPGTYWVELSNGPCKATDTIRIFGMPDVPGTLGPNRIVCKGESVTLRTDIPAKSYRWSDGSTDTNLTTSIPGTYWVDMVLNCGTFRDSVTVYHANPPVVELGRDTLLCVGDTMRLQINAEYASYRWQDGSTNSFFMVSGPGTYKVRVSSPCGVYTDSIKVIYLNPPKADIGKDTVVCLGDSLVWDVDQPFATYRWQDGSTASKYVVRQPGTYEVEVTNRCRTEKATVKVAYEDCTCYLYAPNAFSPNEDDLNDSFKVSFCRNSFFQLQVFNRWGEVVFTSEDVNAGWDGKYRGSYVPQDIYTYVVQVRSLDRRWYYGKGRVTVIR